MKHLAEKDNKKGKPKVTMAQAFKTIIWPRRNLVFIGLILIVRSHYNSSSYIVCVDQNFKCASAIFNK